MAVTPKRAREWVRKHAHSCPCCGAAVMLQVDSSDPRVMILWNLLRQCEVKFSVVPVEDAEAEIREGDFEESGSSVLQRVKDEDD